MTFSTTPPSTSEHFPSARGQRLESLFSAHGQTVFAFARRRATSADADEVVSETFLVTWRRLDEVPDDPLPWLLGVARRCLANINRRECRQAALHRRLSADRSAAPSEAPTGGRAPASFAVLAALDRLSAGERDAVTLLAWEGLTAAEAAVALGCSRAAIYLRLHRARRRLSEYLPQSVDHEETS